MTESRTQAMERALDALFQWCSHCEDCEQSQGVGMCSCGLERLSEAVIAALALPPDPDQSAEIARLTAERDAWKAAAEAIDAWGEVYKRQPRHSGSCNCQHCRYATEAVAAARALEKPWTQP